MGMLVPHNVTSPPPLFPLLSHPRSSPSTVRFCRRRRLPCRLLTISPPSSRLKRFVWKCSITDTDVNSNHVATEEEDRLDELPPIPPGCSIPVVHLQSEILDSQPLNILADDTLVDSLLTTLPVLSEEEQDALAATPAHPEGLCALYACSLAGNLVEQMWNFAWPAAVALLHPSLLPVAVVGFFTKLTIFVGGPLVGNLMDCFPRVMTYNVLNLVQASAQLVSVAMVIHALTNAPAPPTSASSILMRPWFIVLVLAGSIERLSGLALGVAMERDWVVLMAGPNRPIALAKANAVLNRLDLLCEIAGASVFGVLLSKYDPVTCLKLAAGLMICTLPIVVILVLLINKLSTGVLDRCKLSHPIERPIEAGHPTAFVNQVNKCLDSIKHGWIEYKQQPVLPASLAYVFLYFNIVMAPGGLMTAFLTQRGLNPSIIGGFSGLCAFMGIAATFISASLVKHLGVLKAGAAGLIFQASLLTIAAVVYLSGFLSQRTLLLYFLGLIVLSRLGHMSYDVIGTQILQTGIPSNKANLIGATEVSLASLAEFVMLGIAIIANDVSHFGILAMLSVSSVLGATWMFCRWLANPTEEQRRLFAFDPLFKV